MSKDEEKLVEKLKEAKSLTVLTGAGVSTKSGVPSFRGEEGLWKSYSPEELATPQAFSLDPELVWEWYDWRRKLIYECKPNDAHRVIAEWSKNYEEFALITQNVDGLHERAGTENVSCFHGSIWRVSCWENCEDSPTDWWEDSLSFECLPPKCPYCDSIIRPAIVWFGESIPPEVLQKSLAATKCDVFLSIGTSSVVQPAASLLQEARIRGAYTAEINLEKTPISISADVSIRGPADEVLMRIKDSLTRG